MISAMKLVSGMEPGEVIKWPEGTQQEAEEELLTEVPCSFRESQNFMEVSYEEALKVYEDSLDSHIGEFLKDSRRLKEILDSKIAKQVFVPREWTGIKGFLDLDLKFKPNFISIPINPKLYEHAKKEFDKRMKYMYTMR